MSALREAVDITLPPVVERLRGAGGAARAPLHVAQVRGWRHLGVEACRAWVIDLWEHRTLAGRWFVARGEEAGVMPDCAAELASVGIAMRLQQWLREPPLPLAQPALHMVSPRRWALYWRQSERSAVLVQLNFEQGRIRLEADESATIQLLCEHWLAAELLQSTAKAIDPAALERRGARPAPSAWPLQRLAVSLALLSGLLGGWLALPTAAGIEDELQARQRTTERALVLARGTMQQTLACTMATGDYGEVQEALADLVALGHFTGPALVLNPRGQVVAMVGSLTGVRPGDTLPPGTSGGLESFPLPAAADPEIGRLLLPRAGVAGMAGMAGWRDGAGRSGLRTADGLATAPPPLTSGPHTDPQSRMQHRSS